MWAGNGGQSEQVELNRILTWSTENTNVKWLTMHYEPGRRTGMCTCVIRMIPKQSIFNNFCSHTKLIFFLILYLLCLLVCFSLRLDKLSLDIITVLQRWFIKYVSNWPYWIHLDYGWKMKQKKNSRIFPKGKWKEQRTRILKVFFKLFAIQTVSFIFIFYFVSSFCFVCAASISSFI